MKCSVYIATSVDGYIAKKDNSLDWLHSAGKQGVDVDTGWDDFIRSVDCLIMGRTTMEVIAAMNLTPEQWPYGNLRIMVLSNSLKQPPESLKDKVEICSGEIPALMSRLELEGYRHAYVDGGATIRSFINLGLINRLILTKAPVLVGEGIPLFGKLKRDIRLENATVTAFANDFIQETYEVRYD